jgi:hypothetical protein
MIERRRPLAWDSVILLLDIGQLVEVTTLEVLVVVIGGAAVSGALSSGCIKWIWGKKKVKQP